jgi:DNA-binding transcriptional MerR regulator
VEPLTIDELAQRAKTTTRNVRAYQTRGLLPPPRLTGRVGYYDEGHLARLRLISHLQDRGFSLSSIDQLLQTWEQGGTLSDLLGFEEALTEPWTDEQEELVPLERLRALAPMVEDVRPFVSRAIDLGLLRVDGDQIFIRSPRLLRIGEELVASGVPFPAVLDVVAELVTQTGEIAQGFVELFERHVWDPFEEAGMPPEKLPEVTAILRRVRPMVEEAVMATLARAMQRAVADSAIRHAQALELSAEAAS